MDGHAVEQAAQHAQRTEHDAAAQVRDCRLTRAVLATALLLLVLTCAFIGWRAATRSDGTAIDEGDVAVPRGHVVLHAVRPGSPLRVGDQVLAIDGHRLDNATVPGAAGLSPPRSAVYLVLRHGQRVTVTVPLHTARIGGDLAANWPTLLVEGLIALVAGFIFVKRPREPAAHAAVVAAGLAMLTGAGSGYLHLAAVDLVYGTQFYRWLIGECAYALLWAAMLHFALVFPEPRGGRAFRWLIAAAYAGPFLLYAGYVAAALPFRHGPDGALSVLASPALPVQFGFPAVVLVTLAITYRTSGDAMTRRRLRWLAVSLGAAVGLYVSLWSIPQQLVGRPLLPSAMHALVFLPVPIAVAMAVLYHRALDIDMVVSRSLTYAMLTVGVAAIFAGVVTVISLAWPNGDRLWTQLIAVTTLTLLVRPLHAWLETRINQRLFGDRDDPYQVMSVLASRLETTETPDAMLPAVVETVGQVLRVPHVAIELVRGDHTQTVASHGVPTPEVVRMPITYQSERVGFLVVAPRSPRDDLTGRDHDVLADIARHAGAVTQAVRLTRDLHASRRDLIQAREEERRRLLRDLHDSVGTTLAAVALGLQTTRGMIAHESLPARAMLTRLGDELQGAIADIRRLAYELRPPVLDQLGLVTSVREYAATLASRVTDATGRQPVLAVTIETPETLPALPAAVEVAAYRIVCEALTNVARHANAHRATVRIEAEHDLVVSVSDDGRGLPRRTHTGVGLASMTERAAELGGQCVVRTQRPAGTLVRAVLPLHHEETPRWNHFAS
jgi:two-component system NarL family sensor kinase